MAISAGVLFGLLAMVAYGVADFFVERATRDEDVFTLLLWSGIVSTTVLGVALATTTTVPVISSNTAVLVLVAGLLNVVAYLAFYRGVQVGELSIVSPVASAWGAVTALIGVFVLGQALAGLQAAAIATVVTGTILASFRWHDLKTVNWQNYEVGIEHGAVALVGWGVSFAIIDVIIGRIGWIPAIFSVLLTVLIMLLGYAVIRSRSLSPPDHATPIVLVGLCEAVGYIALGIGLTSFQAALVAPIAAAFPVVAVLLAYLFLDEPLDTNQWLGIFTIIAGVVVLSL